MKRLILLLLTLWTLSCSSQNHYELEDQLYDDLVEQLKSENIDFKKEIQTLEEVFIKSGLLKNSSSELYYQMLNTFSIQSDSIDISEESLIIFVQIMEHSFETMSKYENSKLTELLKIEKKNDLTISDLHSKKLLISKKDLEHPYYKAFTLLIVLNTTILNESKIKINLPSTIVSDIDYFRILINSMDRMLVENEMADLEQMGIMLKEYVSEKVNNQETYHILLKTDRRTTYEAYINAINTIKSSFKELKNEYALNLYNKKLDELDDKKKAIINSKFPLNITQTTPHAD